MKATFILNSNGSHYRIVDAQFDKRYFENRLSDLANRVALCAEGVYQVLDRVPQRIRIKLREKNPRQKGWYQVEFVPGNRVLSFLKGPIILTGYITHELVEALFPATNKFYLKITPA